MSVLIYADHQTASTVAATLFTASVIENPYETLGLTYDSVLDETFSRLCSMHKDGLYSLKNARMYQLCEFVPGNNDSPSVCDLLTETLFHEAMPDPDKYVIPYAEGRNWAQICNDFENDIFEHGGIDLMLLVLRPDGSLLYNPAGEELAPVTHVELIGGEKVVSAGMATIMRAKKLLVFATGKESAKSVQQALGGPVSNTVPASYLQLHQNVTFILDEEAASLL